jgi:hypothetical protein
MRSVAIAVRSSACPIRHHAASIGAHECTNIVTRECETALVPGLHGRNDKLLRLSQVQRLLQQRIMQRQETKPSEFGRATRLSFFPFHVQAPGVVLQNTS